jgi:type IV secretion system protein VirB6
METPFQTLETMLLDPVRQSMDAAIGTLTGQIGPVLTAAMTLYVMWFGIRMIQGETQQPMGEFVKLCVKCGFIAMICMGAGQYREWVVNVFYDGFADGISRAFSGSGVPTASRFDEARAVISAYAAKMWSGVSVWTPGKAFMVAVLYGTVLVVGTLLVVSMFAVTLWAKVGMMYVLGMGPIFVALALWPQTKKFFDNFIATIAGFVVTQVLAAALMATFLNGLMSSVSKMTADPNRLTNEVGGLLALMVFCNGMAVLLPKLAAALSNSYAIFGHKSPMEAGRAAVGVGRTAAQAVGHAGSAVATGIRWARDNGSRAETHAAAKHGREEAARYEAAAGTLLSEGRVQEAQGAQQAARMWREQAASKERELGTSSLATATSETVAAVKATANAVRGAGALVGGKAGDGASFNPNNPYSSSTSDNVGSLRSMHAAMASRTIEPVRISRAAGDARMYAASGATVVAGSADAGRVEPSAYSGAGDAPINASDAWVREGDTRTVETVQTVRSDASGVALEPGARVETTPPAAVAEPRVADGFDRPVSPPMVVTEALVSNDGFDRPAAGAVSPAAPVVMTTARTGERQS